MRAVSSAAFAPMSVDCAIETRQANTYCLPSQATAMSAMPVGWPSWLADSITGVIVCDAATVPDGDTFQVRMLVPRGSATRKSEPFQVTAGLLPLASWTTSNGVDGAPDAGTVAPRSRNPPVHTTRACVPLDATAMRGY